MIKNFKQLLENLFKPEANIPHPIVERMDKIVNVLQKYRNTDNELLDYREERFARTKDKQDEEINGLINNFLENLKEEQYDLAIILPEFKNLFTSHLKRSEKFFIKENEFFSEKYLHTFFSTNDKDTLFNMRNDIFEHQETIRELLTTGNNIKNYFSWLEQAVMVEPIITTHATYSDFMDIIQEKQQAFTQDIENLADSFLNLQSLIMYSEEMLKNLSNPESFIIPKPSDIEIVKNKVHELRGSGFSHNATLKNS